MKKEPLYKSKRVTAIYLILRFLVIMVMIRQFFIGNYQDVFLCILSLVLFMLPSMLSKRLRIDLPDTLQVVILLFIFSAEILGEINSFYIIFPRWDDILHTINGFLMAAIGFSLVDILNRSEHTKIQLSPLYVGLSAFCFSMTTGVIWEFFEYNMDVFFLTDMQKDTIITSISSVIFNTQGLNVAKTIDINEIIVNGQTWNYGGYIDIGLIDTMHDLWVNFIGAVVFSILGASFIKGKGKFAEYFIPKVQKTTIKS